MKKTSINLKKCCQQQLYGNIKLKVKIISTALIIFTFFVSNASAQEAINASGGDGSGSGGTVTYSIGNTVYSSQTGTSGSISQGVQNPYEIFVISGINDDKGIELSMTAYPNPVTEYLILKMDSEKLRGSSYQLYNLDGQLLESKVLSETETHISMKNLSPATYLLKIINNNKVSKTFKIIKK